MNSNLVRSVAEALNIEIGVPFLATDDKIYVYDKLGNLYRLARNRDLLIDRNDYIESFMSGLVKVKVNYYNFKLVESDDLNEQ